MLHPNAIAKLACEASDRLSMKPAGTLWQLRVNPESDTISLSGAKSRRAAAWLRSLDHPVIVGYYTPDITYLNLVADIKATLQAQTGRAREAA